jgi:hypothetical protein
MGGDADDLPRSEEAPGLGRIAIVLPEVKPVGIEFPRQCEVIVDDKRNSCPAAKLFELNTTVETVGVVPFLVPVLDGTNPVEQGRLHPFREAFSFVGDEIYPAQPERCGSSVNNEPEKIVLVHHVRALMV